MLSLALARRNQVSSQIRWNAYQTKKKEKEKKEKKMIMKGVNNSKWKIHLCSTKYKSK